MHPDYLTRINTALRYIDENLQSDLNLQHIADIACYSPFHLHRLFKAVTNETLNNYITRKRIEHSALLLIHHDEYQISEIATKFGFKNDSTYTRTFHKIYGQSPSAFRKNNRGNFSKIGKMNSKNHQESFIAEEYLCNIKELKNWMMMNANIEIKNLPAMNLSSVSHTGVDGVENAFMRIIGWAAAKGLLAKENSKICRVFHDSFKVTDADKVRMSIGVITDDAQQADAGVTASTIPSGKHIVARYEIVVEDFEKAWSGLFIWMTENGYKKADANPFEIYHNNMNEHPERKCIVDLVIPIV